MPPTAINLSAKLNLIAGQWSPKIIARLGDYEIKLVKLQGDFVWHSHPGTDEAFLVLHGRMRIDFRDGAVELGAGELLVVPRGVEHKPFAEDECHVLLAERAGTVNTGDAAANERTVDPGIWV